MRYKWAFVVCCLLLFNITLTINVSNASRPLSVLIIGDSVSFGYTPYVKKILAGKAVVRHNSGNARDTGNGLNYLDAWLGEHRWDVIHFNFGLHDLKYVDKNGSKTRSKTGGHIKTPLDQYEKNLGTIVKRLKQTGATLIFATTTPFAENPKGPLREPHQVKRYNAVAIRIMKKYGIQINDLYQFTLPNLKKWQKPGTVHFNDEGKKAMGAEVAGQIQQALSLLSLTRKVLRFGILRNK